MWVGAEYTPDSFTEEARRMGVSKRIPFIPKEFHTGNWVFLAYKHVIANSRKQDIPGDSKKRAFAPGVFYAFRSTRVEKIVTQTQFDDLDAMDKMIQVGITPVPVPDDDKDHRRVTYGKKHVPIVPEPEVYPPDEAPIIQHEFV